MHFRDKLLYSSAPVFSKGGGTPDPPTRVTDNLRSEDTVEVLLGLGEGPWSKLTEGFKSFYIANTPLEASDGTLNFPDAQLIFHKGTQFPDPIKFALGGSGQPSSVGVNLSQNEAVTRSTTTGDIDAIDIRLRIDQLMLNTEEGDQLNEDLVFKIEVKPTSSQQWETLPSNVGWLVDYTPSSVSGAASGLFGSLSDRISFLQTQEALSAIQAQEQAWQEFEDNVEGPIDSSLGVQGYSENIRIYGRTQSPVLKEIRVPVTRLPNDTYDIRVTKISAESTSTSIRELTWESFEQITIGDTAYPNTAMVQLILKASDQLSNVPAMYGIYDMAEILVPTIFDPLTRSYDFSQGPWDGSFKIAHTDDLAWIIYDLVHNDTRGIAAYYNISFSKYEALEASIYWNACNPVTGAFEGVPRPSGGVRPRTTFNGLIETPRNSMELLTFMAGAGNAVFYEDISGDFRLRVERNTPAVQTFNNMDVQNGVFQYSFTDINTRYNDITVVYRNKTLPAYQEDRRRIFDQDDIDLNGSIPLVFAAVGCVDTDEAVTRAYHKLVTGLTETRLVTFVTSRFGAYVEPHDIILISDEAMDEGQSRRAMVVSEDRLSITPNEPMPLEVGISDYVVRIQTLNGISEHLLDPIESTPEVLRLLSPVPEDVMGTNFSFSIGSATQKDLRPFRVTSVSEGDLDETITISAIEVNRNKYPSIDEFDGRIYGMDDASDLEEYNAPNSVQNLAALVSERVTADGKVNDISLTWDATPNKVSSGQYRVLYSFEGLEDEEIYRGTSPRFLHRAVAIGRHTYSVIPLGLDAPQTARVRATTLPPNYGLPAVTGITIENKKASDTTYIGKNVTFSWSVDTSEAWEGWEMDTPHPDFETYNIDIVDPLGSVIHTYELTDWKTKTFEILNEDLLDFGLTDTRRFSIVISVANEEGNEGASFSRLIEKPLPTITGVTVEQPESFSNRGVLRYDFVEDLDFLGVKVWISPTSSERGNLVWNSNGSPILPLFNGDNYITYAAVDILGDGTESGIYYEATISDVQDILDTVGGDLDVIKDDITNLVDTFGTTSSAADLREEGVRVALEASRNARDATIATRNWGFEEGATGWGTSEDLTIGTSVPLRMDEGEVINVDTLQTTDYKEQGLSLIKELITAQREF